MARDPYGIPNSTAPEHKREMFAMQIECMHSAKAHVRIYIRFYCRWNVSILLQDNFLHSAGLLLILARVHFTMQIETATTTWNCSTFKVEPLLASGVFQQKGSTFLAAAEISNLITLV